MEWRDFWNNYQDWKYPCTVIFCFVIGFILGYCERKLVEENVKRKEAIRLAIINTIGEDDGN